MNTNPTSSVDPVIENREQCLFSRLVQQYMDVAYSSAFSILGNPDLARDACQLTFIELSKKANRLPKEVKLGGWIYTTSRNMARKIQRTEIRRQQREQHYVDQMNAHTTSEIDWARLVPEIHETLEHLKASEREIIILRFFQKKSLADIGDALGMSADAARMRLKRALQRMNGTLAKKGIYSTAAALGAALPAHAVVSAPAGAASSISTSILAGAGTTLAGATTLTGAVVTIMKAKTIVILASATAIVGTSVYLSTRSGSGDAAPASGNSPVSSVRGDGQASSPAVVEEIQTASVKEAKRSANEQSVKPINTAGSTGSTPHGDALDINPKYLKQANRTIAMLEMAMSMADSGAGSVMLEKVENPARQLQLRLELEPEKEKRCDEILSAYAEAETLRSQERTSSAMDIMKDVISTDRDGFMDFMALQSMQEAGETLTSGQQTYLNEWNEKMSSQLKESTDDPKGMPEDQPWYKNQDVLAELNATLAPDQQNELKTYVEEQKAREREQAAYERTNDLANKLGLNEADRLGLYAYLYKNPKAADKDIAEQLAPELRELMLQKQSAPDEKSSGIRIEFGAGPRP